MKSHLRFVLPSLLSGLSFAYYPFSGEDTGTVGKRFGFELETDIAYFKYYDGSYQQDYIVQITSGLSRKADIGIFIPYSRVGNGSKSEGLNDIGVFFKHVPYRKEISIGYRVQVNTDTGKRGIGYGKTTLNLNLMGEYSFGANTLNLNLFYVNYGQVEGLRDSYGLSIGMFRNYRERLSYGAELTALQPEDSGIETTDVHLILGLVYHTSGGVDVSFGLHKTLTYDSSLSDYGVLVGSLIPF